MGEPNFDRKWPGEQRQVFAGTTLAMWACWTFRLMAQEAEPLPSTQGACQIGERFQQKVDLLRRVAPGETQPQQRLALWDRGGANAGDPEAPLSQLAGDLHGLPGWADMQRDDGAGRVACVPALLLQAKTQAVGLVQ